MFEHIKEAARRMTKEQREEALSEYNKLKSMPNQRQSVFSEERHTS